MTLKNCSVYIGHILLLLLHIISPPTLVSLNRFVFRPRRDRGGFSTSSLGPLTAPVLASQAEAIVDLGRTWPQHRIDIH